MQTDSKNILIISSRNPSHSAGLGQSIMDCLAERGHHVDFLTRYSYDGQPSNVFSIEKELSKPSKVNEFVRSVSNKLRIRKLLKNIRNAIYSLIGRKLDPYIHNNGITIKYLNEQIPDVDPSLIIEKIKKPYDGIITLFWQDLINSTSLSRIYERLHCPILIYSPDMSPMTGGCFYFNTCRNFRHECGECPGFNSNNPNDQSHKNYIEKKNNYNSIACAFLGNSWMNRFAKESKLFKNIENIGIIIDQNIFIPSEKDIARKALGIEDSIKYILMLRADAHPRKGTKDIAQAYINFYNKLSKEEKGKCLIISVGDDSFISHCKQINCKILNLGKVNQSTLIYCYQASSFFINASHDDAGPSMINQSLMCGTPVICYNNGTAIDVITNNVSGYSTETGDIDGLSDIIYKTFHMDDLEYSNICKSSREIAMTHNSKNVIARKIESIIEKLN